MHSFGGGSDGAQPLTAGLVNMNGTLYGTTSCGGAYGNSACFSGGSGGTGGTFFSVTTGGAETVLYSFGSGSDGSIPTAGLVDVGGTLYGTTQAGGIYGKGTVFSINTKGTEKVLHSFGNGSDGSDANASLVVVKGVLYGMTARGGTKNRGTVFSISTSGMEQILYRFRKVPDGSVPEASLVYAKGKLYGTTVYGGSKEPKSDPYCCGVVFSLTMAGKEKVLHSFGKGSGDGWDPVAGLIDVKGKLYGTTINGGKYTQGDTLGGTVFSISLTGTESVLHSFSGGSDGYNPNASLSM
ncbi:MAG TPA: choice-of-anchor tandem repeat GloVer-containing protein [Candidatus Cybelea sp.]